MKPGYQCTRRIFGDFCTLDFLLGLWDFDSPDVPYSRNSTPQVVSFPIFHVELPIPFYEIRHEPISIYYINILYQYYIIYMTFHAFPSDFPLFLDALMPLGQPYFCPRFKQLSAHLLVGLWPLGRLRDDWGTIGPWIH